MSEPLRAVRVWDLPVRAFHWTLVALVLLSWASRELDYMELHRNSGYGVLVLVLFRVIWGFAGTRHARFADFLRPPSAAYAYLRDTARGRGQRYLGHNPAGGWSVVAMLACLAVQAITGLFLTDDVLFDGPFHGVLGEQTTHALKKLHDANFTVLLALVGLHLAAIGFYRVAKREDLVRPMLTGVKRLAGESPAGDAPPVGWWRAPLALAIAAGLVAGALSLAPGRVW
jgi:cytochrome b